MYTLSVKSIEVSNTITYILIWPLKPYVMTKYDIMKKMLHEVNSQTG